MVSEFGSHDWRDRKIREWLLLLLRFAVTQEPTDQGAALAVADELDSLGVRLETHETEFLCQNEYRSIEGNTCGRRWGQ